MEDNKDMEYVQKLWQLFSRMPMVQTLHMELVCAELDHACLRISDLGSVTNNYGAVHGGAMMSLADTTAGMTALSDGRHYVSQSCSFEFLSNIKEGSICAEGRIVHRGRHVAVVKVDVFSGEKKLLATGLFNMYVVDRPFVLDVGL